MNGLKDIYFYNALGLATELRNGTVTEYRAVKHLIATLILAGISFEVPIEVAPGAYYTGALRMGVYTLIFISAGIISYYGAWLTYQANKKGDGKDYFLRFAALTLPVGIQLVVLFLWVMVILIILSVALSELLGGIGGYVLLFVTYLTICAFTALFYIRMRNYIAIASGLDD